MAKGYKTGGRKLGTPNKDNPFKVLTREHSADYARRDIKVDDCLVETLNSIHEARIAQGAMPLLTLQILCFILGKSKGELVSLLDIDAALAGINDPARRLDAEARLANFHSAKMKESAVEFELGADTQTSIETRLATLAGTVRSKH